LCNEKISKLKYIFLALFIPVFTFNILFSLNNYFNEVRVRKKTDAIDNQLVNYFKSLPYKAKVLICWNNKGEFLHQIRNFNRFNGRDDLSIQGYIESEHEVFDRDTLQTFNIVAIPTAKNVHFNRIVWNDGLTILGNFKRICPQTNPIAIFSYKILGVVLGREDNLPYFSMGSPTISIDLTAEMIFLSKAIWKVSMKFLTVIPCRHLILSLYPPQRMYILIVLCGTMG